ncbi:MAG: hypothetical protein ACTSVI_03135 [Promethearchaeota archaeon]
MGVWGFVGDINGDGGLEVIFGSDDYKICCLNGKTGIKEWSYTTGDHVLSSPVIGGVDGDMVMEILFISYLGIDER